MKFIKYENKIYNINIIQFISYDENYVIIQFKHDFIPCTKQDDWIAVNDQMGVVKRNLTNFFRNIEVFADLDYWESKSWDMSILSDDEKESIRIVQESFL